MKHFYHKLLYIILLSLVFQSCNKEDELGANERLLTSAPWKLAYAQDYIGREDKLKLLYTIPSDSCTLLEFLTLYKNRTAIIYSNCRRDSLKGKWKLSSNSLTLILSSNTYDLSLDTAPNISRINKSNLLVLSSDSLILRIKQGNSIFDEISEIPSDIDERRFYLIH